MNDIVIRNGNDLLNGPLSNLKSNANNDVISKEVEIAKIEASCQEIFEQTANLALVKTIWKYNEPVSLDTFYYPAKLSNATCREQVRSLLDLPETQCLVISGTAGQGKSIFLRYLCLRELESGRTLPIFVELRKVRGSNTLQKILDERLDVFENSSKVSTFTKLAKSGKLTVFLDGFDELPALLIGETLETIERLKDKNKKLRILITSRPGTDVLYSGALSNYELSPLDIIDIPLVAKKLTGDVRISQRIAKLLHDRHDLIPVLKTPLSVALLLFVYQSENDIPNSLTDFYDGLFPLLYERHDKSKPGFQRPKRCTLNQSEMHDLFDTLCFFLQLNEIIESRDETFYRLAKEAIDLKGLSIDQADFIADIVNITCMLVRDGINISAIHRSVIEFHCARFISNCSDQQSKEFYSGLLEQENWAYWTQVLSFLKLIDPIRVREYYTIPDMLRSISGLELGELRQSYFPVIAKRINNLVADNQTPIKNLAERALNRGPSDHLLFSEIKRDVQHIIDESTFNQFDASSLNIYLTVDVQRQFFDGFKFICEIQERDNEYLTKNKKDQNRILGVMSKWKQQQ